ncbi:hypothetical protein [Gorillibacterium timonense]|uniref:hypothetical protein n=1 Tax=Gorillibacterium timonense TaxID=1689269 RepID=UPI00071CAC1E|nr:hypothetical protein [Gorillibacterium timonense]
MKGLEFKQQTVDEWLMATPAIKGAVLYEDDSLANGERGLLILFSEEESAIRCLQFPEEMGKLVQVRLSLDRLKAAPYRYEDRSLVHWLRKGIILTDPEEHLSELRRQLDECTGLLQEKLVLTEFCLFYRHYLRSKRELENQCLLDSFENLLQAIHHWGRLAVVEQGHYPERMIWDQVRVENVGVFKLYEELTSSSESLLKRIQLVLLASDFCVVSKTTACCSHLLRLLESREEPWGLQELERELGGAEIAVELGMLLSQLEVKALIREVLIPFDDELAVMERKFFRSLDKNRRQFVKP